VNRLTGPLAAQLDAVHAGWQPLLSQWAASLEGRATTAAVDARVACGAAVYPRRVFRAFEFLPPEQVQVVILGQDPYHGEGQAEGLAFSVPDGQRVPPSLRNIFKELQRDLGLPVPSSGSLQSWARQGVLLLNSALTVEDGRPGSHAKIGWHVLTHAVLQCLVTSAVPKVFMLWGAHAQAMMPSAHRRSSHQVLESNHPSPLSASRPPIPFVGCGHFGSANQFLSESGRPGVSWRLG
jgi:uracil-DNA glycosylase